MTCDESAPAASRCSVEGRDDDDDGYKSSACEADAGDDCDDTDDTVHPDADELCDGKDNDCNSAIDLNDGLNLGSRARTFADSNFFGSFDVVWAPEMELFGIVYSAGGTGTATYFGTLDAAGEVVTAPKIISTPNTSSAMFKLDPRIAWDGESFGVVELVQKTGPTSYTYQFVSLSPVGELQSERQLAFSGSELPVGLNIVRLGDELLPIWSSDSGTPGVVGRYIDKDGAFSGPQVRLLDGVGDVSVAASEQGLGMVRTGTTAGANELSRYTTALTKLASAWKVTGVSNAKISGRGGDFFVAYNRSGQALVAKTSDGAADDCTSSTLAGVGNINDVAAYASGAIVLSGIKSGDTAKLTAIGPDCAPSSPAIELNANPLLRGPIAASSPSSTLVMWLESEQAGHALYYRLLGEHLCD